MASWPIVRWTVPRLGVAYAWALLPFLYTRSKNRSDSLHEVPSLPFKIYEVAMKAWRIVKCCDTQFHVKDARKNAFVGRATSWNFFG